MQQEFTNVAKMHYDNTIEIDNAREDIEARIDAAVFKIYDVHINEMISIMNSDLLSLRQAYQEKVIEYYRSF